MCLTDGEVKGGLGTKPIYSRPCASQAGDRRSKEQESKTAPDPSHYTAVRLPGKQGSKAFIYNIGLFVKMWQIPRVQNSHARLRRCIHRTAFSSQSHVCDSSLPADV